LKNEEEHTVDMQAHPVVEKMVFRNTNRHLGRDISVTPSNSTSRHLCYGRIILNRSIPSVSFNNGDHETGLICLSGSGTVQVDGESFGFAQYDSIYIPRSSTIEVRTAAQTDFAEFSSDVENRYPLRFLPYAEIAKDPALKFTSGKPGNVRQVCICLGRNIEAGRLLLGFTISDPGNWTSWPPHEHAEMLEEMYVYFDMPWPAYGIQLVYNDLEHPELVTVVQEGDAVLMPGGYHPNVSVPGHRIAYLWAMAAHREKEDRQFGVFNVQPDFNPGGSAPKPGRN
jgi:5-deoxy-glucuronate isomerase